MNESNGYGVSLFANFGEDDTNYQNFALTPYYRFYFLNRKDFGAGGMFVEVFSSFSSANFQGYQYENKDKDEFQFSMGIALGKKWVNRNGFSFEAFAGFGRYFNKFDNGPERTWAHWFGYWKTFLKRSQPVLEGNCFVNLCFGLG